MKLAIAGDSAGAARDLQRSVGLLPTAEGYYGLGQAAQHDGRHDQAIGFYRQASASKSEAGTRAGRELARLDLQQNPSQYLDTALGLSSDGYLVVKISNQAAVAVRDVRIVVGEQTGSVFREQAAYRLDRSLASGHSVQLKTDLGPMNASTARRFAAVVRDARLVE